MWIKVHEGKIVNLENGTVIKQVMQFNGEDNGFYYIFLNDEVIADFGDEFDANRYFDKLAEKLSAKEF